MVSIITITYNRAHLIEETIKSVLAQSYSSFEYLIVDDGSDDNTEELIRKINDSRIKYHKLPRSGALNKIRNYGITHATGKYIAFIDSDDTWMENKLELQIKLMEENSELGFTFCEAVIYNEQEILFPNIYNQKYKGNYSGNFFYPLITDVRFFIFPSSIVIRKECLNKTGLLDEELMCADKDLYAQLAYHFKAALIDKCLVRMRRHDSNISNKIDFHTQKILEDEIVTLTKFYRSGFINKNVLERMSAVFYYKQGEFFYHQSLFKDAKKRYYNSLLKNPLQAKALAKYLLSYIKS